MNDQPIQTEETLTFRISPALLIFLILPTLGIAVAVGMIIAEGTREAPPTSTINTSGQAANLNPVPAIMDTVADDFSVTTLDGETVSLSDFRGRVVFLNFWATWCPPCVEELPAFQQFASEQGASGAVVLAANNTESPDTIRSYLNEHAIDLSNVPVLLDSDSAIYRRFGVVRLPTTYMIDVDGNIAAVKFGSFTVPEMYEYLYSLQEG